MSVDLTGWKRKRAMVEKQAPFATALALTQTAKDAQKGITQRLPRIFDRPTAFTRRSITIIPAKKARPVAWVLVKDLQAQYLAIQETGGVRRARRGSPINIPVNIRTNVSGNIPRRAIKREVAKPNVFTVGPNSPEARQLPPGIYRRARGRKRSRQAPTLLVALERTARYRPRFDFKRQAYRIVRQRFAPNFEAALARALKTAK